MSLAHRTDLLLAAALRCELSETQARALAQREPEDVTLALPALARRMAEQNERLAQLDWSRRPTSGTLVHDVGAPYDSLEVDDR